MDSLPNFLTHGAPLCALRAREELRYKFTMPGSNLGSRALFSGFRGGEERGETDVFAG